MPDGPESGAAVAGGGDGGPVGDGQEDLMSRSWV